MGSVVKAMVYHDYGSPDNLELGEIEMPEIKDDGVLVNVHAASINWHDWHFLTGSPFLARIMAGLLKPKNKVLGIDLAGRIEAVGASVTQYRLGDEVFGSSSHGCFAEYVSVSADNVQLKPTNITFEAAAAVPGAATTALQALRDCAQIQPGQKVLINGASGGVGTFAVPLAKYFGAEVTGVCSARNLDLLRSIGADQVIDYTQEDFTQNGQRYDLIIDTVGNPSIYKHFYKRSLSPKGICVIIAGSFFLQLFLGPWMSITGSNKIGTFMTVTKKEDLISIKELLEASKIVPVIDKCYPLSEVPEAILYLNEGHARGNIVILV
jgi:NADPH:quinone reductase-like Zn-dependent oxidoreductase